MIFAQNQWNVLMEHLYSVLVGPHPAMVGITKLSTMKVWMRDRVSLNSTPVLFNLPGLRQRWDRYTCGTMGNDLFLSRQLPLQTTLQTVAVIVLGRSRTSLVYSRQGGEASLCLRFPICRNLNALTLQGAGVILLRLQLREGSRRLRYLRSGRAGIDPCRRRPGSNHGRYSR